MAHSRRLGFRARSSTRRQSAWNQGPNGLSANLVASGASAIAIGQQAAIAGLTIVRIRGRLTIFGTAAATAANHMFWAFGICIVSENAFGVGITAIPHPQTDIKWDGWMYHTQGVGTTTPGSAVGTHGAIEIDSKAMRKIKDTDFLIGVVEATEVGTSSVQFDLESRILVKLS